MASGDYAELLPIRLLCGKYLDMNVERCFTETMEKETKPRVRKVIVEHPERDPRLFLSMDEEGRIEPFTSAREVVRHYKARDERAAKLGKSTITVIEWRDMGEDFTPPEVTG